MTPAGAATTSSDVHVPSACSDGVPQPRVVPVPGELGPDPGEVPDAGRISSETPV